MDILYRINIKNYKYCLDIANKLLNDKDNIDDVYFYLYKFITDNNTLVSDHIIKNNLILLAKHFFEILDIKFNDLKKCIDENKLELYNILIKNFQELDIYNMIELNDTERFLNLMVHNFPDIITYSKLAKHAIFYERINILEIILSTIKLEVKTIKELYKSTDNKQIKELFRIIEPDLNLDDKPTVNIFQDRKTRTSDSMKELLPIDEELFKIFF